MIRACIFVLALASCSAPATVPGEPREVDGLTPFTTELPGTELRLEMLPAGGGELAPFWISRTEIPWEWFDAFVFEEEAEGADALARPTKPYITVDRGFGHNGFPAMSISVKGARAFCVWLSARTGRAFRLPRDVEWKAAAGELRGQVDDFAWHAGNAGGRTHEVATRAAGYGGVHDMHGNVAEWCEADGGPVVLGGAFVDPANDLGADSHRKPTPDWNRSDPQIPKSPWWLADAPFVGFRVVCVE